MKVARTPTILVAVVLLAQLVASTPEETQAFHDFLMNELTGYPGWLVSNNLDPSPVFPDVISLNYTNGNLTDKVDYFNTTGEIRNQQISGHSSGMQIGVSVNLENSAFDVLLFIDKYNVTGEYHVEAQTSEGNVSASGNAELTAVSDFLPPLVGVTVANFTVNAEGYIDLSMANVVPVFREQFKGKFEGLSYADRAQGIVIDAIGMVIYPRQFDDWSPLDNYLLTFLQEVFAKTPYADIIRPLP